MGSKRSRGRLRGQGKPARPETQWDGWPIDVEVHLNDPEA